MKNNIIKTIFVLAVATVLLTDNALAQGGYHQVGDTIRGRCPIYYYDWWPVLNANNRTDSLLSTSFNAVSGYMKHTTNTPLRVIGVASTFARLYTQTSTPYEDLDPTIEPAMDYVLFDATASGLVEKARVRWTDDYMTHPKRYMELPIMTGLCSNMVDRTAIVSLREYYFDSAITVTDSFYLGCAFKDITIGAGDTNGFEIFSYYASHNWDYCAYGILENDMFKECATIMPVFTYYDSSRLDNAWHYITRRMYQLVFPIIEVDTFCVTPEVPYVASRDSQRVRVEWVDGTNLRWEVSRTAPNGDPNTGLITPTTVPYIEYTDIDNDSTYHVYVRGYCDRGVWQGWSDWSTPGLIDSLPTQVGINEHSILGSPFSISPNPTDGTVQIVGLQDEMVTIEVMDLTGRVVEAVDQTTRFDVSALAAGIYIVRVKTKASTAAPEKVTYLKLVKK